MLTYIAENEDFVLPEDPGLDDYNEYYDSEYEDIFNDK